MRSVFADTSFYQALLNRQDSWHEKAARFSRELRAKVVTTEYVLVELGALMARGEARLLYVRFVEQLRSDPDTEYVPASAELFNSGFALFAARPDKDWSLTDCTSFALMQERNVDEVLTADHHFEQAGFTPLLRR